MLDIKFIKENIELVKANNQAKGVVVDLNRLISIYDEKNKIQHEIELWRAEKNKHSKIKPNQSIVTKLRKLGKATSAHEAKARLLDEEIKNLISKVPNLVLPEVPRGPDETYNKIIRSWGNATSFDFTPLDHVDIGKNLDLIDIETSAKVSGSRFCYLKNEAVWLQFALIQFAFSIFTNQEKLVEIAREFEIDINPKPFSLIVPPDMIKPEVYRQMARLTDGDEDKYYLAKDDLYLIGSAEHTLGPMHINEEFNEIDLPIRYLGYSTAFRREAGTYGKDTRGILRVHQFDKLEIESFSLPEQSAKEQDFIVAIQEHLLRTLKLPYQVVMIASGDMGAPDARQVDIETWMPGQNQYRETHTSDLMTDYQSRRLNIKFKRADGSSDYVHMNDATAFAIGRTLIAILENNQQVDGSITIPLALQAYVPFTEIKPKLENVDNIE